MKKALLLLANFALIGQLISAVNIVTSKSYVQDEITILPSYKGRKFEIVISRDDPSKPRGKDESNTDIALKILQALMVSGSDSFPQDLVELAPSYKGVKLRISVKSR